MNSFTDLKAWQKGLELVEQIYRITQSFPRTELFGITSQLRRASSSILANIAEGHGRYTFDDKAHKYVIARGECSEVAAFIHISLRLKFITKIDAQLSLSLTDEIGRMLSGLIAACRRHSSS
jgi:four helix bundle protein